MVLRRKAMVKELQQLAGFLNFLNKAIFAGRVFTWRMYSKYASVTKKNVKNNLKDFHHIKLDQEFKTDCRVWLNFFESDMLSVVSRPFVDFQEDREATLLEFYSDASLNPELGFGARYEKEWTYAQWPTNFIHDYHPSIEFIELYGLAVAVFIWCKKLVNKQIVVHCDNESVVYMVNNTSSSCGQCMKLLRGIILKGLHHNFRIFAKHLRSEDNEVVDCLSRLQFAKFVKLMKKFHLRVVPEPLPDALWPVTKIWEDDNLLI